MGSLKSNDIVTGLHGGNAFSNRLDDTGTFVAKDHRERSFGILSGEGVRICVADTSVVNLNTDFVGFGWFNFNILDGKGLAGSPCDSSLCRRFE